MNSEELRDILDCVAAESTASREEIRDLLDVDAIEEAEGKVTKEAIRRQAACVEQAVRIFGHHRTD